MLTGALFGYFDMLLSTAVGMTRILPVFFIVPFLSGGNIQSVIKYPVVFFIALSLSPQIAMNWTEGLTLTVIGVLLREIIIGIFLGCLLASPVWIFQIIGNIVDNQRGATLSSILDPAYGVDSSVLANFFNLFSAVIYLNHGGMVLIMDTLYKSYQICPPLGEFTYDLLRLTSYINHIVAEGLVLASPVIVVMLGAEVILGILSRYASQLNAFSVSLTVKSGLAFLIILITGVCYLVYFFSFTPLLNELKNVIEHNFQLSADEYARTLVFTAFRIFVPLLFLCIFVCALVSLFQSKFQMAFEAIRIKFDALNPVNGLKKIFSLRTIKELIKTILYLTLFGVVTYLFWVNNKWMIFIPINHDIASLFVVWGHLLFLLVIYCLVSLILVMLLDYIAEYFLFMKDMKMDREEIKREYKEQDGDPEVKNRRKELHRELLSEQLQSDISNSRLIIANPEHIAIGIYFKPEVSPVPLISVRETNQVALAVRKYAEKKGIPVVRDIPMARRIYATHRRYDILSLDELDNLLRLLIWLENLESARQPEMNADEPPADTDSEEPQQ